MAYNKKQIVGYLSGLPVILWIIVILAYSVNVPWYDDFDPFPDFLRQWISSATLTDKILLLIRPNNEHRMVIGKLVTLIYFWLTGKLNFTFLHIAGACFTMGTLYLFWLSFKESKINWWYFLPIVFLFFQLQYYLVYLWAICSLQHQPVVFFLCLSMFFLSRGRFGWAVVAAFLANYSMSNGIFVWAAGGAVLFLRSDYKKLLIWCIVGAVAIGLYFYGLTTMGNEESIEYLKKYPELSVLGFFAFLGGLFDLVPERKIEIRTALPIVMGLLLMIWVVKWLWFFMKDWVDHNLKMKLHVAKIYDRDPGNKVSRLSWFLLGVMIFLLINALIIGLLRPRFGFFVMVVSNYKLYPALFLIVTYLAYISYQPDQHKRQIMLLMATALSIFIWAISLYSYLPIISERSKYLKVNGWNQAHHAFGLGHVPFSAGAKYVDTVMQEMVNNGIYEYPEEINYIPRIIEKLQEPVRSDIRASVMMNPDNVSITEPLSHLSLGRWDGTYAFLRSEKKLYLYKMAQQKYNGRNLLKSYDKGTYVQIPLSSVEPGNYEAGILKIGGDDFDGGIIKNITIH
ncbi:hypothetical protein DYBT9275_00626 [Dyadobacter sp. CECT 9275]|uniref:Uncharacterized protein n=1 Tax=Dyadobacter helix TaxID=2822344 RepID=A0A916JAF8_9BACT|nr:hypothetical protein [Dyadobacter sp. CECT 9275]CAG4990849.1 hypothetical protein DYBT9275_00626 [Dyadobacter sp. CECT 9275]